MITAEGTCPLCIDAGVDEQEAAKAIHTSNDQRYNVNGRQTGRCMRSGKHPHGGPVDIFMDTGELVKKVEPSPFEYLYNQASDPPSVWGMESSKLKSFGVKGLLQTVAETFRAKYPDLGKKLPSFRVIADAEANNHPIDLYPLYNQTDIIGIEVRIESPKTHLRPGEYGPTSPGKIPRIVGEAGLFIANPYPKHTPEIIVIFEGAKDACIAACDAIDGDMISVVFCGCSASFKQDAISKTLHLRFPGTTLISVGDRDKAGTSFQAKMLKLGAIPQSLKGCIGKDLGDEPDSFKRTEAVKQLVSDGISEWHRRQETRPANLSVMDQLQREGLAKIDDNGIPKASTRTTALARIFELDPKYSSLSRNLMGSRDFLDDVEITDDTVTMIQNDLDKRYGATWGIENLYRQISLKCATNSFHPVNDYINNLPPWDDTNRYPWILEKILGTHPSNLNCAFLACFFRAAVARIMDPGVKHDVVFVLKSTKQGVRKTSFFNACTANIPGAFIEAQEDVISKDGLMTMHRGWIVELGEIDQLTSKKNAEIVKNFLSRKSDVVRPPYGRRPIEMHRSFVNVGTTNQETFLMDTTGHRRFHVIETGDTPFNLPLFQAHLDQVWAQALAEYRRGEPRWLSANLAEEHQREMGAFEAEEPWATNVANAIGSIRIKRNREGGMLCEGVTAAEILGEMEIRAEAQTRLQGNRIGGILRQMGWTHTENQVRRNGKRLRLWRPPQHEILEEMSETGGETGKSPYSSAVFQ
jgi:predicted P-loop ATPase